MWKRGRGESLALNWGGGPGGHRVGTGPREQLSRQFYSTPPTTRAAIDDISTLLQKMSGILFLYGFALAFVFFFISSNILPSHFALGC